MQRSGSLRPELYKDIEVASVDSFQVRLHPPRSFCTIVMPCHATYRSLFLHRLITFHQEHTFLPCLAPCLTLPSPPSPLPNPALPDPILRYPALLCCPVVLLLYFSFIWAYFILCALSLYHTYAPLIIPLLL